MSLFKMSRRLWSIVTASILLPLMVMILVVKINHRPNVLDVYIFSLSKGHAIFIRTPDDKRVLLGGGGNASVVRELTRVMPFYSKRIDSVIASIDSGSEAGGLIDVMKRFDVGRIYLPGVTLEDLGLVKDKDQIYDSFLEEAALSGLPITKLNLGDVIDLGPIQIRVLFPAASSSFAYSKSSRPEMVFLLKYEQWSLLYAGNISKKIQKFIASSSDLISNIDVLVANNTFRERLVNEEFITKTDPEYLVYSMSRSSGQSDDEKSDDLIKIPAENRFNVKESRVHIRVSDGRMMMGDR